MGFGRARVRRSIKIYIYIKGEKEPRLNFFYFYMDNDARDNMHVIGENGGGGGGGGEKNIASAPSLYAHFGDFISRSFIKTNLAPHQKSSLIWMLFRERFPYYGVRGGINAKEMGLGKTLEMLHLILLDRMTELDFTANLSSRELTEINNFHYESGHIGDRYTVTKDYSPSSSFPSSSSPLSTSSSKEGMTTLIVTDKTCLTNWIRDIEKHFSPNTFRYTVINTLDKAQKDTVNLFSGQYYHIVFISYRTIQDLLSSLNKDDKIDSSNSNNNNNNTSVDDCRRLIFQCHWYRIICDEIHVIRNAQTGAARALRLINSKRRWGVTGTPIHNTIMDLVSLYSFLQLKHPYMVRFKENDYDCGPKSRHECNINLHFCSAVNNSLFLFKDKSSADDSNSTTISEDRPGLFMKYVSAIPIGLPHFNYYISYPTVPWEIEYYEKDNIYNDRFLHDIIQALCEKKKIPIPSDIFGDDKEGERGSADDDIQSNKAKFVKHVIYYMLGIDLNWIKKSFYRLPVQGTQRRKLPSTFTEPTSSSSPSIQPSVHSTPSIEPPIIEIDRIVDPLRIWIRLILFYHMKSSLKMADGQLRDGEFPIDLDDILSYDPVARSYIPTRPFQTLHHPGLKNPPDGGTHNNDNNPYNTPERGDDNVNSIALYETFLASIKIYFDKIDRMEACLRDIVNHLHARYNDGDMNIGATNDNKSESENSNLKVTTKKKGKHKSSSSSSHSAKSNKTKNGSNQTHNSIVSAILPQKMRIEYEQFRKNGTSFLPSSKSRKNEERNFHSDTKSTLNAPSQSHHPLLNEGDNMSDYDYYMFNLEKNAIQRNSSPEGFKYIKEFMPDATMTICRPLSPPLLSRLHPSSLLKKVDIATISLSDLDKTIRLRASLSEHEMHSLYEWAIYKSLEKYLLNNNQEATEELSASATADDNEKEEATLGRSLSSSSSVKRKKVGGLPPVKKRKRGADDYHETKGSRSSAEMMGYVTWTRLALLHPDLIRAESDRSVQKITEACRISEKKFLDEYTEKKQKDQYYLGFLEMINDGIEGVSDENNSDESEDIIDAYTDLLYRKLALCYFDRYPMPNYHDHQGSTKKKRKKHDKKSRQNKNDVDNDNTKSGRARQFLSSAHKRLVTTKMRMVKEYFDTSVFSDEKVVLFSKYIGALTIYGSYIKDTLDYEVKYMTGKDDEETRQELIQQFATQSTREFKVFAITTGAFAQSINLTRANHVIVLDEWFNPRLSDQAHQRIIRPGQIRIPYRSLFLIKNTFEEIVYYLACEKAQMGYATTGVFSHQRRHILDDRNDAPVNILSLLANAEKRQSCVVTSDHLHSGESELGEFNMANRLDSMRNERAESFSHTINGTNKNNKYNINVQYYTDDSSDTLDKPPSNSRHVQWKINAPSMQTITEHSPRNRHPDIGNNSSSQSFLDGTTTIPFLDDTSDSNLALIALNTLKRIRQKDKRKLFV